MGNDKVRPASERARLREAERRARAEAERLAAELKATTSALRQLQERQDDLVHAVSHDLRNPLTAIMGQAQLLQRALGQMGLPGSDRAARGAEAIAASAKRMNIMIQDLVDATRLESGQLQLATESLDLGSFLADLLERSGDVLEAPRVKTQVEAGLPSVQADPNRLERILLNLLSNALKYSPAETEVLIRAGRGDGEVVVSVVDRGVGIEAEDLAHLFERFYTARGIRKSEGLGLGLYAAGMLVGAHGGRIWAESEAGRGNSLSFTLPVAEQG